MKWMKTAILYLRHTKCSVIWNLTVPYLTAINDHTQDGPTRTYAVTLAFDHTSIHMYVHMYVCPLPCICMYMHMYVHTYVCTLAHSHTLIVCTTAHMYMHAHMHTHMRIQIYAQAHATQHTCVYIRTICRIFLNTYSRSHMHVHALMHARSLATHVRAHTVVHSHSYTPKHARTVAHAHACTPTRTLAHIIFRAAHILACSTRNCARPLLHACSLVHAHLCKLAHTHTHARRLANALSCTRSALSSACVDEDSCMRTLAKAVVSTFIHARLHTHTQACTHVHTYASVNTLILPYARIHTISYERMTYVHTHWYIYACMTQMGKIAF